MPDRAERVSKGSQYDILDSFWRYFGLILDDFGLILEIFWRYVGYILRVFLNESELSNPNAKNCKEPCIPPELPKRRITSRCGGVAYAFSIVYSASEAGSAG